METLLDLIFENLFFVVIILGAIWNFISRMANGEAPKGKEPKKVKPISDDLDDVFLFDEDEEEERHQSERRQRIVDAQPRAERYEEVPFVSEFEKKRLELEALQEQQQIVFERVNRVNKVPQLAAKTEDKGIVLHVKEIGNAEIAQAVIWSEILGKPRALNPHRHSKR